MLRTQEAALYSIGEAGVAALCEAICLDAIDVTRASRVSVWFFTDNGSMVCQRQVDARDGRIRQGAVIPPEATGAYLAAAGRGLDNMVTDDAPVLHDAGLQDDDRDADAALPEPERLDLLLVDGVSQPAAVLRCERPADGRDWSDRDLKMLRSMAQTLAATIRREAERYSHMPALPQLPAQSRAVLAGKAGRAAPPQSEIRLPLPQSGRLDFDAVPDLDEVPVPLAPRRRQFEH
ncbi:hypothetical protein [Ferrovibrio sp.]|uniref:hypothetical protein n=1 Tax=Ferrovibrio sp. TaxID=1917215 RepID=UPI00312055A1